MTFLYLTKVSAPVLFYRRSSAPFPSPALGALPRASIAAVQSLACPAPPPGLCAFACISRRLISLMDLLLDYGDLGAIVKAGFSSPDPSVAPFTSIAAHASSRFGIDQKAMGLPASGAAFSGFCVPLFSSSELPGVSNAFGLLPSPTPLQYPVRRGPVFASSGGPSQTLRMPASSSLESLYSKTLDAYDSSSAVCPSPTAAQHSLTPESAYAPPNTMALGQHEDRFITICQKILAANDPLAATRSVLNSMHTPSSAAGTGTPAAPVVVPSSIPSIFLRPLQMQPATSPLPNIPNDGGDKRSAETELASRSAPDSSNSNRARPTKRRKLQQKRVVQVPAIGAISSKPSAGETVPSDMWAWRKYGQKPIKGSPHPRGYYKCSSSKGCPARKQVERNPKEPSMLVVTYTSEHNHPWPTNRINALAGSTRKSSSSSTTTAMHELSPICSSEPSSLDAASHHSPASIAVDDCVCASPLSVHDDPGTPGPQDGPAAKSNTPSSTGIAHGDLGGVKMDEVISRVSDWQMDAKLVPSSSSLESMWLGGQEATVAEDSEGQLLDNLLSEMLEKVQRQNKGNEDMAMKMMGQEDDDDDDELFFNWSNSFNFCSQVNHVVQ